MARSEALPFSVIPEPWLVSLDEPPNLPPLMSRGWSLAVMGSLYLAINTWTYFAWYRNRATSEQFLWRDEGWFGADTYAGGSDKLGHMWGAYVVHRIIANTLQAGSWGRAPSNVIAGGAILGYLSFIEVKDAYHPGYGFSMSDMVANIVGTALGVVMDLSPRLDQMFDFRLEYVPSDEYLDQLTKRGVVNAGEDYSGQTYIFAFHLASLGLLQNAGPWGLLDAVDLTVAYSSDNYLPKPTNSNDLPTRTLSFGIALNVQYLIDRIAGTTRPRNYGHATARFLAEVLAVPYTNLPVVSPTGTARMPTAN